MLWSGLYILATAWDEFGVWPDYSQRWPSRGIEALPAVRVSETWSNAHASGPCQPPRVLWEQGLWVTRNELTRALVSGAALDRPCGQFHSLLFITKDYTCRFALLPGRWEPLARMTGQKGRGQHRLVKEAWENHSACWCDRYQVASLHSNHSARGILLCKASPLPGK